MTGSKPNQKEDNLLETPYALANGISRVNPLISHFSYTYIYIYIYFLDQYNVNIPYNMYVCMYVFFRWAHI